MMGGEESAVLVANVKKMVIYLALLFSSQGLQADGLVVRNSLFQAADGRTSSVVDVWNRKSTFAPHQKGDERVDCVCARPSSRFPHVCLFSSKNDDESGDDTTPTKKTPKVSNLSDLDQQLRRFQYTRSSKFPNRPVPKASTGINNDEGDGTEEWRELQRQIEQEEMLLQQDLANLSLPSIIEKSRERGQDEKAVLDALSSPSGETLGDIDAPSLADGFKYDEVNLPPGAIPSQYQKKYISNFEITEDGGVYLSPEAYQQACGNAANPDGSLNLTPNSQDGNDTSTARTIFSPSVLETVTARPMAPYGTSSDDGKASKQDNITLEDLSEQARKAKEYIQQNPNAQEELHQRIMAEEEEVVFSDPSSKLFEEALLDPEKARQFWNQEYFEMRRQETEALEKMLDEKLKLLEQMSIEAQAKLGENASSRPPSRAAWESESRPGDGNSGSAFGTVEEQKEFLRIVEQEQLQHAKNVARLYKDKVDDWDWGLEEEDDNLEGKAQVDEDVKRALVDGGIEENDAIEDGEVGEWILMEDPSVSDDRFYWNTVTEEMRWDPPTE